MGALNAIFGPSRKKVWYRLAAELGARYVSGGFGRSDRVEAASGGWTIILETYYSGADKRTYTRLRAEYVSLDGFRFTVYRRGLFTEVAKSLGMQDVEVGDPYFDEAFIIQGNNPGKLKQLFANDRTLADVDLFFVQGHVDGAFLEQVVTQGARGACLAGSATVGRP